MIMMFLPTQVEPTNTNIQLSNIPSTRFEQFYSERVYRYTVHENLLALYFDN